MARDALRCFSLNLGGLFGNRRDRSSGLAHVAEELFVRQLEAPAQNLDLHFVSQVQRVAKVGGLAPVHCFHSGREGATATGRALRRPGRGGDCLAPREDSVSINKTCGMDQRSAVPGNI
jgi:hypothetical protein